MSVVLAEQLLQRAYNLDIGSETGVMQLPADLRTAGVMDTHYVYYNSGLVALPEIRKHLETFPNGVFNQLIVALRDARLGDYSRVLLNKMYGLSDNI